eukprot:scaffold95859_cov31-Tisochrysis_lutea.AAC.1
MTFTSTDRGITIKDEEAFSAIVAHLNKLKGMDLEPEFLAKSSSGPWAEILVSRRIAHNNTSPNSRINQGVFALHGVKYPMIHDRRIPPDLSRQGPRTGTRIRDRAVVVY